MCACASAKWRFKWKGGVKTVFSFCKPVGGEYFTVCVEGLEKLFHAGSLKEDERTRRGYKGIVETNAYIKGATTAEGQKLEPKKPAAPGKAAPDKPVKRKEQESTGKKAEEPESQRPLCRNFITSEERQVGCKCRYYHLNKASKCRICGSEST